MAKPPTYVPKLHHDNNCDVEYKGTSYKASATASRAWWCKTHNQWTYNFPTRLILVWPDSQKESVKPNGEKWA